ncbi:unnamed protein product [Prunus armeniaca]|uniref:Uncharacterized protein n=1 Tax=Prunus armeniaca TaxID=36596 RepID=A0A6J5UR42_PRUAR|nr:unnamed protein product [Prunus armeniaca]CAB4309480.1 unnamed protein product [Prunus armeniaca]
MISLCVFNLLSWRLEVGQMPRARMGPFKFFSFVEYWGDFLPTVSQCWTSQAAVTSREAKGTLAVRQHKLHFDPFNTNLRAHVFFRCIN